MAGKGRGAQVGVNVEEVGLRVAEVVRSWSRRGALGSFASIRGAFGPHQKIRDGVVHGDRCPRDGAAIVELPYKAVEAGLKQIGDGQ